MSAIHLLIPREPASTWTHLAGFLLAVFGVVLLWRQPGQGPGVRLARVIYGFGLLFCYAASTLYHAAHAPADILARLDRLDRVGIFFLIAGSYTPLAWTLLDGRWRTLTLAGVWLIAVVSSVQLAVGGPFPQLLSTALYLGMGWGVLVCYRRLARVASRRSLGLLVLGGVFYSVGAVINVVRRPDLWPGVFGPHELFHLFVIAGSLAHFRLILDLRSRVDLGRAMLGPSVKSRGSAPPVRVG